MTLETGTRLGPYEIQSPIGAGGMGEVYRARDRNLSRDVALKVLPTAVALDADRLARFRREAHVLASLNHPNIAAIYGFEESNGVQALVLELVDGPTLEDRIARGPVPLDEAIAIGRQIAEAVEAAHEQGIVHRDLKPANIKVRPDGTVKVLDFGLAKALEPEPAVVSPSPTMTSPAMTRLGVILGTASYMSPEQAKGQPADKRSDVWAFGCVLYEMVTGDQLFRGETMTDVLAAIVRDQPDLSRVPPTARRLVQSCLEKDPRRRLQALGDASLLLDDRTEVSPPRGRRLPPWLAASAGAFLTAAGIWTFYRQPAAVERAFSFHVNPPPGTSFKTGGAAISSDGQTMAFVAATSTGVVRLWVRPLESLSARELPGTDGASYPFWAPDGQSLGFFADGKLKKIDLSLSLPADLAPAAIPRGGAWNTDGTILFQPYSVGGLQRVTASGGTPSQATTVDVANGENAHRWPQFLPGGRRFLYFVRSSKNDRTGIYLGSLDSPEEKTLVLRTATSGAYAPLHGRSHGYLLWLRENNLIAQPFAPERAQLSGEPVLIAGGEAVGSLAALNMASFSVSNDGTLLFSGAGDNFDLTWFSRNGKVLGTIGKRDRYVALRISPDGSRAAVSIMDPAGNRDLHDLELARGLPSRLTSGGGFVPAWSPNGEQIAYHSATQTELFTVNRRGDRQTVLQSEDLIYVTDWSPDGQFILYTRIAKATLHDLWLLPLTGDRKPVPFLVTAFSESHGQFSPDGKWIAYTSNASGQNEIYVQPLAPGVRQRVSRYGGSFARWRKDSKELFYLGLDGQLMSTSVQLASQTPEIGNPVALFRIAEPLGAFAYPYDVAQDGQRILALGSGGGDQDVRPSTVLVNWAARLRR